MSANRGRYYTLEEYFAVERVGNARYEYWDGDIVCMSGGSEAHGRICGNVYFAVRLQTGGGPCQAFTSDVPVKTPTLPPYRYPDTSLACGTAVFENINGVDVLVNPVLVVEVLSPQTEKADRGAKFEAYKAIDTVCEYLLIAQNEPHLTHFVKQETGEWRRFDTADLTAMVALEAVGCTLAVADVYATVAFP